MSKILRVARTEYLNQVRTKAFIISIVLMPVLMGGAIVVQALTEDRVDLRDRRVAVVDHTGKFADALRERAEQRNTHAIHDEGRQTGSRFLFESSGDEPSVLSDRVRSGKLFAYLVIGADVIEGGPDETVAYHTDSPTYDELPRWIRLTLGDLVRRERFDGAGIDQALVNRLTRPVPVQLFGLMEVTAAGEVKQAEEVNEIATFAVPAASMFLLFMLVMMAAPALLNNVLEEKIQRISEVLVSAVSPFELFMGKLIGTVFVSWTLTVIYVGGIAYLAYHFEFAELIPASTYAWLLFFQLVALMIFGSLSSALGAACSELRDAQTMMMPLMMCALIPMFVWMPVLRAPDSTFATIMSLIPFATPFLMMLRIGVPPGPAIWELVLGVALSAGFAVVCVWAAGRIFRIGLLSQGQTPSFRKLLGWVFAK